MGSDTSSTNVLAIGIMRMAPVTAKIGFGTAHAVLVSPGSGASNSRDGFSVSAGLTVDVRLAGSFFLAVNADWLVQRFGELSDFPRSNHFVALTLGVTFRTGIS